MALTFANRFAEELVSRVEEDRTRIIEELMGGHAVQDMAAYRERVGYIRALDKVAEWCDEVEAKLIKGE